MAISLKYWNGRGLMEVPRMLLAISGKFPPLSYTDGRFDTPTTGLDANLGRMPVVMIGNRSIGQSSAINQYIATECGLMGGDSFEAAHIVSIAEHLKEMHGSFRSLVPNNTVPKPENLDLWFDGGATDVTGMAVRKDQPTRYLQWWMGRMERTLDSHGFAVGKKLSLADVLLYSSFVDTLRPEETAPGVASYRTQPFASQTRTAAMLAKHPKILASCNTVATNANIKKWLAMRGVQNF